MIPDTKRTGRERNYMTDFTGSETYRLRGLLVDDERSIRDLLYALLENEGYEVVVAGSGEEGLRFFRQSVRPIELLVTDYDMPGMTGLELARQCSCLSGQLSVLYVSGSRPDEQLLADLQARKRAFLAKPFHAGDLLRKARELLLDPGSPQMSLSR